jgi:hypothetical protein
LARKKDTSTFSPNLKINVLEGRQPQVFQSEGPENGLELARTLCVLANAGEAAQKPVGSRSDRERHWVAQALELLNWVSPSGAGQLTPETWMLGNPTASECATLGVTLRDMTVKVPAGQPFIVEQASLLATQKRPGHYQIFGGYALGRYQDIVARVLADRAIDLLRFARCANTKCGASYYKPRLSSQACSRRCENVLMARVHHEREKKRRTQALELRTQGKSLSEIARTLGVRLKRARQYVANKQPKEK